MTATHQFQFQRATKAGSKARIALLGGPGAGKTRTALEIAKGLDADGGRIAVIDTDRQRAKLYADVHDFDWLGMHTFDPADLTRATIDAADQNIGVLIVDTWSPFWSGVDGMLDQVGRASTSFEGWRQMRPVERQMFDALLGFPGHVIVTLRTKVQYVVEPNDKGKMEPRRLGLQPEQRDGTEYEFDVVIDLDDAGAVARVSKTRCPELANKVYNRPTADVGVAVQAWLDRDAVGHLLNPQTVREWAMPQHVRTAEELKERYRELEAVGQTEAVVYAPDGTTLIGIGDFLRNRWRAIEREQAAARREAARREETARRREQPPAAPQGQP